MLEKIFNKHNSDKGSKHFYHLIYEKEFSKYRNLNLHILEVGIFKGQSISSWLEYFPTSTIYGIDIFTRIKDTDIKVLNYERVKYLKANSRDSNIKNIIHQNWPNQKFDIIIDDGLHTPLANRDTFLNLIDCLKNDGSYYIEDVWPINEMSEEEMKHPWIKKNSQEYTKENMNVFLNSIKNYNVEIFDNRKISQEPDSVIYKIKR